MTELTMRRWIDNMGMKYPRYKNFIKVYTKDFFGEFDIDESSCFLNKPVYDICYCEAQTSDRECSNDDMTCQCNVTENSYNVTYTCNDEIFNAIVTFHVHNSCKFETYVEVQDIQNDVDELTT